MEESALVMMGLPKGSLEEATINLFSRAGWQIVKGSRSYRPVIDDPELDARFIRAQEIGRYVAKGFFDCGLTGYDWVVETGADVVEVSDLMYSRASNVQSRWILAVPEDSPIQGPKDLQGKRIVTEVVEITNRYLAEHGVEADVEFSWGATEVKVPDMADAIVDLTETGSSLRANKLRIVDTLLRTNTKLIANKEAWANPEKRQKIEAISLMLRAALEARSKAGLKMNVPKDKVDTLLAELPALRNPTVNRLTDPEWVAIDIIADEKLIRDLIPKLKEHGAEGIIEYPLSKVVY